MPRRPWLTNSGKTKYEIEVTRERHTAEKLKKYSGELIFLSGCRRGFQADFVWMLKDSWCQGDKESRGNRCWGWKETSRALLYPHIPLLTVPHLLQNLRAENRWMRREFGKLRSGRERWAEKWGTGLWIQNHQICGYSWVACCCCLVTKSCLTLCDPMSCSMPGFPVLHSLPEFAQTHRKQKNNLFQKVTDQSWRQSLVWFHHIRTDFPSRRILFMIVPLECGINPYLNTVWYI